MGECQCTDLYRKFIIHNSTLLFMCFGQFLKKKASKSPCAVAKITNNPPFHACDSKVALNTSWASKQQHNHYFIAKKKKD